MQAFAMKYIKFTIAQQSNIQQQVTTEPEREQAACLSGREDDSGMILEPILEPILESMSNANRREPDKSKIS